MQDFVTPQVERWPSFPCSADWTPVSEGRATIETFWRRLQMRNIGKYAAAATLAGAMALSAVTPSQAHDGRWGAAAVGFGAGALVGAAAAGAAYNSGYYGPGYGYGYAPGYAY